MRLTEALQNEEARLNALRDLKLLDTPPSESFDRLTRMASQLLSAPVSTISLTDHDRQWFKSRVGVEITEIPRDKAPCNYAIRGGGVLVVPDMTADPRFADSPLVDAGIRFYAGAPLFTRAGHGLGTLCIVDTQPRELTQQEQSVLQDLASMVMTQIDLQNMIGRVDATSGLPNQHQFFEEIDGRGLRGRDETVTALMVEFLSPLQARQKMRVLGPSSADEFASAAMARVQGCLDASSRLYHVGPMRCAVIVGDGSALIGPSATPITEVLRTALLEPIPCDGVPITPEPVIGTYVFKRGSAAPRDVLRRLLAACDDALETQATTAAYNPTIDQHHARSFTLLNDFSAALRGQHELTLHYQPRTLVKSGELVSAEALLRWTHPLLGPISPAEFVPMIEQTALARPLTEWVSRTALAQIQDWRKTGLNLAVSINASALNLDEEDFAERLLRAVEASGVHPHSLELEFTESAMARNASCVIEQLTELKRQGIAIAIDDFGTGYSNLARIQQLPISVLKIDRSFISPLPTSRRCRTLVRAMITMAHDLGYRVVAEGIETPETLEILAQYGCDQAQGYLIAKPMTAGAMSSWRAGRLAA